MTRIHVAGLPHTRLTREYDWCAYTAKVRRLGGMLTAANIGAVVYGAAEEHEIPETVEYVPLITEAHRRSWFGVSDWPRDRVFDRWDAADPCWDQSNRMAAAAIRERWEPGDILGLIGGRCQQPIADLLADLQPTVCEWGVGYAGVLDQSHKVFESYAWAHHVAGLRRDDELRWYDTVIPNCYDPADLTYSAEPGGYLLFMARPTARKGLAVVADIAARSPIPVIVAGQPGEAIPNTTHAGIVTGQAKANLLAGARAVLCPTTYLEPFGGVAVEAMLSGTPVISSDWGAFTETVVEGVSGFRCSTLSEFLTAVDLSAGLDRAAVRRYAADRYTIVQGSAMYSRYLHRLDTLRRNGWYEGSDL